jgi:hypothetical protein
MRSFRLLFHLLPNECLDLGTEQASRRALCRRLGYEPASNIRAFRLGNKNCAKSRNMDRTPATSLVWPACRFSLAAPVAAVSGAQNKLAARRSFLPRM